MIFSLTVCGVVCLVILGRCTALGGSHIHFFCVGKHEGRWYPLIWISHSFGMFWGFWTWKTWNSESVGDDIHWYPVYFKPLLQGSVRTYERNKCRRLRLAKIGHVAQLVSIKRGQGVPRFFGQERAPRSKLEWCHPCNNHGGYFWGYSTCFWWTPHISVEILRFFTSNSLLKNLDWCW